MNDGPSTELDFIYLELAKSLECLAYKILGLLQVLGESILRMLLNLVTRLFFLAVGIHTVLSRTVSLTRRDDKTSDLLPRATSPNPVFLVYTDAYDGTTGPPAVSQITVRAYVGIAQGGSS